MAARRDRATAACEPDPAQRGRVARQDAQFAPLSGRRTSDATVETFCDAASKLYRRCHGCGRHPVRPGPPALAQNERWRTLRFMNVQHTVSDWGTMVIRRVSKAAPDQGGWNVFCTDWSGFDMMNPAVEQVLRCGGAQKGSFGWPDLPKIEALREAWIEAPDEDGRRHIARDIQALAMQEVPYLPLGQYLSRTAYRSDLQDVVKNLSVFWNVRRVS